jgi:hypothetical protein
VPPSRDRRNASTWPGWLKCVVWYREHCLITITSWDTPLLFHHELWTTSPGRVERRRSVPSVDRDSWAWFCGFLKDFVGVIVNNRGADPLLKSYKDLSRKLSVFAFRWGVWSARRCPRIPGVPAARAGLWPSVRSSADTRRSAAPLRWVKIALFFNLSNFWHLDCLVLSCANFNHPDWDFVAREVRWSLLLVFSKPSCISSAFGPGIKPNWTVAV